MKTKSAVFILFILMQLLLSSCSSPMNTGPNNDNNKVPIAKPPLELGTIRILVDRTSQVSHEKETVLLDAIATQINNQYNISMNLEAVYSDNGIPADMLVKMYAANDPPEIVIRSWYDVDALGFNQQVPAPLVLNGYISEYGKNLDRIPEYCWELSKIGKDIVSIPSVQALFYELVANKDVMDAYHWDMPTNLDEFNDLLKKAKDNGIIPMKNFPISVKAWFNIPTNTYRKCSYMYYDTNNELQSCYLMPEYLIYIETVYQWLHSGYIDFTPSLSDTIDENDNWLFCTTYPEKLGEADGVIPVPNISVVMNAPITHKPNSPVFCFESYRNPIALVVLLNWLIENEDNYRLVMLGEENADYVMTGNRTYEIINKSWTWKDYFSMYGTYNWTLLNSPNVNAVNYSISEMENYSSDDGFYTLPLVSERYAVPGSNLAIAWEKEKEYEIRMEQATMDYLMKKITIEEYTNKAKDNYPLVAKYKQLLEGFINKTYKPEQDMYIPRHEN